MMAQKPGRSSAKECEIPSIVNLDISDSEDSDHDGQTTSSDEDVVLKAPTVHSVPVQPLLAGKPPKTSQYSTLINTAVKPVAEHDQTSKSVVAIFKEKLYMAGFVYKLNELGVDGLPLPLSKKAEGFANLDSGGVWEKWWMELRGSVLTMWLLPEVLASRAYFPSTTFEGVMETEGSPSPDPSFLAEIKKSCLEPLVIPTFNPIVELLPYGVLPQSRYLDAIGNSVSPSPPIPYNVFFALSTHASNLFYFCVRSTIAANAWAVALRLSSFEFGEIASQLSMHALQTTKHEKLWKELGLTGQESLEGKAVHYEAKVNVRLQYASKSRDFVVVASNLAEPPTLFELSTANTGSNSSVVHNAEMKEPPGVIRKLFGRNTKKKPEASTKTESSDTISAGPANPKTKRPKIEFHESRESYRLKRSPLFSIDELTGVYLFTDSEDSKVTLVRFEGHVHFRSGASDGSTFKSLSFPGPGFNGLDPFPDLTTGVDTRPAPTFVELIVPEDQFEHLKFPITALSIFGLLSSSESLSKRIESGTLGLLHKSEPTASPWGLLYLSPNEVAGLAMTAETTLLSTKHQLAKVLSDKASSWKNGFVEPWVNAIESGNSARTNYESAEIASKVKGLVQWIEQNDQVKEIDNQLETDPTSETDGVSKIHENENQSPKREVNITEDAGPKLGFDTLKAVLLAGQSAAVPQVADLLAFASNLPKIGTDLVLIALPSMQADGSWSWQYQFSRHESDESRKAVQSTNPGSKANNATTAAPIHLPLHAGEALPKEESDEKNVVAVDAATSDIESDEGSDSEESGSIFDKSSQDEQESNDENSGGKEDSSRFVSDPPDDSFKALQTPFMPAIPPFIPGVLASLALNPILTSVQPEDDGETMDSRAESDDEEVPFQLYSENSLLAKASQKAPAGAVPEKGPKRGGQGPLIQLAPEVREAQEKALLERQSELLAHSIGLGATVNPKDAPKPISYHHSVNVPTLVDVNKRVVKPKIEGGLLGEVDRWERERDYMKKMGSYRPVMATTMAQPTFMSSANPGLRTQNMNQPVMAALPVHAYPAMAPNWQYYTMPSVPNPNIYLPQNYPVSEYAPDVGLEDPVMASHHNYMRERWLEAERLKEQHRGAISQAPLTPKGKTITKAKSDSSDSSQTRSSENDGDESSDDEVKSVASKRKSVQDSSEDGDSSNSERKPEPSPKITSRKFQTQQPQEPIAETAHALKPFPYGVPASNLVAQPMPQPWPYVNQFGQNIGVRSSEMWSAPPGQIDQFAQVAGSMVQVSGRDMIGARRRPENVRNAMEVEEEAEAERQERERERTRRLRRRGIEPSTTIKSSVKERDSTSPQSKPSVAVDDNVPTTSPKREDPLKMVSRKKIVYADYVEDQSPEKGSTSSEEEEVIIVRRKKKVGK